MIGGQRCAACSPIQVVSGVDATRDGAACVDLRLHVGTATHMAMLRHHQAPVRVHRGALVIMVAGEALVLGVALQDTHAQAAHSSS